MKGFIKVTIVLMAILVFLSEVEAKKRKFGSKAMQLRQKETNAVEFIRLVVMRLIFGIATRFGLGEQISGVLNGAFVPPGVDPDYYDYGGGGEGGLFDDGDDYDY